MEEKEGSTAGFVLSIIGGVLNMLIGAGIILKLFADKWSLGFLNEPVDKLSILIYLIAALYFLVLGVWILAAAYWMEKVISLKKGAWTSLALGILSLNIPAIIGGVIGIRRLKIPVLPNTLA